jgi:membrane protease YdiL (CAAX protease family)
MSETEDAPRARWGMGDAALGIVASFVLSQVGVVMAIVAGGYKTTDDFPLWVIGLVEIPLWIGLLGAVYLASTRKGTGSLRADFGLLMRPRDIPIGLAAGFGGQLVIVVLVTPIYRLLGVDTDRVGETAAKLADRAVHGIDVVVLVLFVAICAPIVEELFYRGLLLRSVERRFGTVIGVIGTSVLFAVVHFQVYDLLPLALAGLLFSVLSVRSGRLGPSIWAHMAFNLTAVVALLRS